jgi:hypothetical protein
MSRKETKNAFGMAVLLAIILFRGAFAVADEADVLVNRALKLSGMAGQMDMIGKAILSAIPADAFADSKSRGQAESLLAKRAGKESLVPIIRRSVEQDFSQDKIERVIKFYASPLGLKVGRLTEGSASPQALKGVWEGRDIVTSLSESRRSALERIIKAERVVEFNTRLLKTVIRGLVKGYAGRVSLDVERMKHLRAKLDALENEGAVDSRETSEVILAAFARTFQSLKEEDLGQLATYLESDAAVWFRNTVQKGLERAAFKTAVDLGEIMARGLEESQGK